MFTSDLDVCRWIGVIVIFDAVLSLWLVNENHPSNNLKNRRWGYLIADVGRFVRLILGIILIWI
jgi:hypothetical protein